MNKFNCIRFAYQRKTLTEQTKKHNKQIEKMIICVVLKHLFARKFFFKPCKGRSSDLFLAKKPSRRQNCNSGGFFFANG